MAQGSLTAAGYQPFALRRLHSPNSRASSCVSRGWTPFYLAPVGPFGASR